MIDAIATNAACPTLDNPKKANLNTSETLGPFQGILAALTFSVNGQNKADTLITDTPETDQATLAVQDNHTYAALWELNNSVDIECLSATGAELPTALASNKNQKVFQMKDDLTDIAFSNTLESAGENLHGVSKVNESDNENTFIFMPDDPSAEAISQEASITQSDALSEVVSSQVKIQLRDLKGLINENTNKPADTRTDIQPVSRFRLEHFFNPTKESDAANEFSSGDFNTNSENEEIKQAGRAGEEFEQVYTAYSVNQDQTTISYEDLPRELTVLDTEGSFVHDLMDTINYSVKENHSEIEIQLKPEHLGKLMLKVSMDEGVLAARLTVESSIMKDFINSHLKELKSNLSLQGFSLSNLDVDVGSRQSFSNARYHQSFKPGFTSMKQNVISQGRDTSFKPFNYPSSNSGFNAFV